MQWGVGGAEAASDALTSALSFVRAPLLDPQFFAQLKISPPCGLLLFGPPGSGKTMLVRQLAAALGGVHLVSLPAGELLTARAGDSERKLLAAFDEVLNSPPPLYPPTPNPYPQPLSPPPIPTYPNP